MTFVQFESYDCQIFIGTKFCFHCGTSVSRTVYYQHKSTFYNKQSGEWLSEARQYTPESDDEEFTFDEGACESFGGPKLNEWIDEDFEGMQLITGDLIPGSSGWRPITILSHNLFDVHPCVTSC